VIGGLYGAMIEHTTIRMAGTGIRRWLFVANCPSRTHESIVGKGLGLLARGHEGLSSADNVSPGARRNGTYSQLTVLCSLLFFSISAPTAYQNL